VNGLIEEENLLENTHVVGGYFGKKLEELRDKYPLIAKSDVDEAIRLLDRSLGELQGK
jgi:hypothetical protein